MSVVAIAMVRDEADIIEHTVRRMAEQVDRLIVADNLSRDGTREILDGLAGELPLEVLNDPDLAYRQSAKMSYLARYAKAEWVVPFDADEVWRGRGGRIADILNGLPESFLIAEAALYDHVATGADPDHANPLHRIRWRRPECAPLPKVACRFRPGLVIHQGNHGATYPGNDHPPTVTNLLSIRHFPYRSVEQFIRKVRNGAEAYAATDLPDDMGAHWRKWGEMTDDQLGDTFRKWYWREDPEQDIRIEGERQPPLVHDPV